MNSSMREFEMACDELMFNAGVYLAHIGKSVLDGAPIGSGRYRWGSGDNPYQHAIEFYQMVSQIKKEARDEGKKLTYPAIAKMLDMSPKEFKNKMSNASAMFKSERNKRVYEAMDSGMSLREAEAATGISESTIRKIMKERGKVVVTKNMEVAEKLKEYLKDNDAVDLGPGTELALGYSRDRIKAAVALLEETGEYKLSQVWTQQLTGKGSTNATVLAKADIPYQELREHPEMIKPITNTVVDTDGNVLVGIPQRFESVKSDRIYVNYAEDGGIDSDGIIEIRRGCPDLNLGDSHYAQVRIAVDDTHFLKGVARYNDNIPEGYDIMVQSNKKRGTPLCGEDDDFTVAKNMKKDPSNRFKATIKDEDDLLMVQKYYFDENGNKKLSALNVVNEEGTWEKWSKSIASQLLSKEDPDLAKRQLALTLDQHTAELDSIKALTNPTVKKMLLEEYSNQADARAKELKASPFPGQHTRLLLPINSFKNDNECYCEDYPNGTVIYAVRYPHGGTFETAELVVNNNNPEGRKLMGGAVDGIGVTPATRQRLSGADCDGDTVITFPRSAGVILKTGKLPKAMENFDPDVYKLPKEAPKMNEKYKNIQMGIVSNLITDMTIKIDDRVRKRGYMTAEEEDDIVRAVKASMVIIDAPKHRYDWKACCKDLRINDLKRKYQYDPETDKKPGGASTLISRAKNTQDVWERKSRTGIYRTNTDPETGAKIVREKEPKNKTYIDPETGKVTVKEGVRKKEKVARMDLTDDARTLSSGTLMENIYADFANGEKRLANEARKEYLRTPRLKVDKNAKQTYKAEVDSLTTKLRQAKENAPLERYAVRLASATFKQACRDNPDLEGNKDEKKKLRGRLTERARNAVGARKKKINITEREWEAIQAGALSENVLMDVLKNADSKQVRQYATPRTATRGLTTSQINTIKNMVDKGYTREQAAEAMCISVNQVNYVLAPAKQN